MPPGAPLPRLPRAARAIAQQVLLYGPQPRNEIARRLELSAGSVTRLTRPLIDAGILVEQEALRGVSHGRPTLPLDVAADAHEFVGVKLTADHLYLVITDLRSRVVAERSVPLVGREPAEVADLIVATMRKLNGRPTLRAIGVTVGGRTRDRSTVVSAPFLGWTEVPLGAMLTAAAGLPAVVDNDVVALTESLHWFGAGRGLDRFAVLTIGAGIGYALVVHDRIVRSPDGDVGILGYHQVGSAGRLSPTVAGRTVAARSVASLLTSSSVCSAAGRGLGRTVGYEEVLDLAGAGDVTCRAVVDEAAFTLGRLIQTVATVAMTERIILSGEGVRLATVGQAAMAEGIAVGRPISATPITLDVHPMEFSEWARGAAVIAIQAFVLGPD